MNLLKKASSPSRNNAESKRVGSIIYADYVKVKMDDGSCRYVPPAEAGKMRFERSANERGSSKSVQSIDRDETRRSFTTFKRGDERSSKGDDSFKSIALSDDTVYESALSSSEPELPTDEGPKAKVMNLGKRVLPPLVPPPPPPIEIPPPPPPTEPPPDEDPPIVELFLETKPAKRESFMKKAFGSKRKSKKEADFEADAENSEVETKSKKKRRSKKANSVTEQEAVQVKPKKTVTLNENVVKEEFQKKKIRTSSKSNLINLILGITPEEIKAQEEAKKKAKEKDDLKTKEGEDEVANLDSLPVHTDQESEPKPAKKEKRRTLFTIGKSNSVEEIYREQENKERRGLGWSDSELWKSKKERKKAQLEDKKDEPKIKRSLSFPLIWRRLVKGKKADQEKKEVDDITPEESQPSYWMFWRRSSKAKKVKKVDEPKPDNDDSKAADTDSDYYKKDGEEKEKKNKNDNKKSQSFLKKVFKQEAPVAKDEVATVQNDVDDSICNSETHEDEEVVPEIIVDDINIKKEVEPETIVNKKGLMTRLFSRDDGEHNEKATKKENLEEPKASIMTRMLGLEDKHKEKSAKIDKKEKDKGSKRDKKKTKTPNQIAEVGLVFGSQTLDDSDDEKVVLREERNRPKEPRDAEKSSAVESLAPLLGTDGTFRSSEKEDTVEEKATETKKKGVMSWMFKEDSGRKQAKDKEKKLKKEEVTKKDKTTSELKKEEEGSDFENKLETSSELNENKESRAGEEIKKKGIISRLLLLNTEDNKQNEKRKSKVKDEEKSSKRSEKKKSVVDDSDKENKNRRKSDTEEVIGKKKDRYEKARFSMSAVGAVNGLTKEEIDEEVERRISLNNEINQLLGKRRQSDNESVVEGSYDLVNGVYSCSRTSSKQSGLSFLGDEPEFSPVPTVELCKFKMLESPQNTLQNQTKT